MTGLPKSAEPLVAARRKARMEDFDALPPEWKTVVHEYGYHVAKTLMECGVKKPKHAVHVIRTIMDELNPLMSENARFHQGPVRTLVTANMLPVEPTEDMIAASMSAIEGFIPTLSKREKHRLRLRAAAIALHRGKST